MALLRCLDRLANIRRSPLFGALEAWPQMFARMRDAKVGWPHFSTPQQMTDVVLI